MNKNTAVGVKPLPVSSAAPGVSYLDGKEGVHISVVGCGHVGLVVAACLAKLGHSVTVVDTDVERVKGINNKISPIYELGMEETLSQVEIEAASDSSLLGGSEIIFICVPTPSNQDGAISLECITQAAKQIALILKEKKGYCLIAVKSTVVPGTTEEVIIPILESSGKTAGIDFGICMTPEFLREGKGIGDFMNPSRIVIGEYDKRSGDVLSSMYQDFNTPILRVNLKTAEMIKYASNTFLATKISFINEIGNICKRLGIDIYQVTKGMGLDERIGAKFLNAGIGFAGPCLPKDLKALIAVARQTGYEPRILEQVLNLNERQPLRIVDLLKKHVSLKDRTIGVLGLAFKPQTDDVKDSLAITVVEALVREGAGIKAYDPMAMPNFAKLFPDIKCVNPEEVLECDAIVILTEWEEFEHLDYRGRVVIDGRKVDKAREAKIYEGICW